MQNKANFKMGNINISTARTKAYAKEQRTMNNERYPEQTQSNPIPLPSSPGWRIFSFFSRKLTFLIDRLNLLSRVALMIEIRGQWLR